MSRQANQSQTLDRETHQSYANLNAACGSRGGRQLGFVPGACGRLWADLSVGGAASQGRCSPTLKARRDRTLTGAYLPSVTARTR